MVHLHGGNLLELLWGPNNVLSNLLRKRNDRKAVANAEAETYLLMCFCEFFDAREAEVQ